ncbi:bifunctional glutamate--cysteine ligase GshA/glutathione synthetase GshB [Jeotgalibaca arthritidis]|uniref:Glutathione biosynthesis bifunctional protein GshAB n=1 Tax=Jeotgalibaca arthritidis TaxID=1868794 RepID=A0A6G7KBK9_9LACT|nr:bifunctional glutamate--cysteine ligase GshA/glutathione synthetase GshB [Jeotgalibaca arthritidis]QII82653.1 bifunctional glutamate--cysteine ligase GshA/glutathione synthetase GshB [Jeotgalibaca arthritidis]
MNIKTIIKDNKFENLFTKAIFGVEKESQRILRDGTITESEHPHLFGNRTFHPYIQTDFAESQLELVTPPVESVQEVEDWLAAIHDVVHASLNEDEYMLPFSLPIHMPEEDMIHIAKLDNKEDVRYRDYLAKVYGKKKQMMSGIHFNFEFHPDFLQALYEKQNDIQTFREFQTAVYFKLTHNFLRYQWMLTYLLGASVEVKDNYFQDNTIPDDIPSGYIRSLRSSKYGYVNNEDVNVSFNSLEEYVESIERMVSEGKLIEEKEFYSPVRFRGGKKARQVLENGVAYLEFRLFDLNPFSKYGISKADMSFVHSFFMYLLWIDEATNEADWQKGRDMNSQTAFEHPLQLSAFQEEGLQMMTGLLAMLEEIDAPLDLVSIAKDKYQAFLQPEKTISGQLVTMEEEGIDLSEWATQSAVHYKETSLERPYALTGFEDMELSTQILLFDAIQQGLEISILDRSDQFISLKYGDHLEYVKNGNMTALDSYISPLIMENKVVTKKILAKHGFSVPASMEYTNQEQAVRDYQLFANKAFVVKPKSTNYGLGISIFKEGANLANFTKAVAIALKEDDTILVEDFVEGTEYRFFVIGEETKAVLLRVPANVTGDGIHTIKELVAMKNEDPLRGKNHRSPLEKIELGDIELMTLEEQGYQVDDIPEAASRVYLRDNSNVSTGGDSIDYTDKMDESYKQLAAQMATVLGATISGMDMMIKDYQQPSTKENPGYGVIEANFNPMMMMHIYPFEGESRRLTRDILDRLFPEMTIKEKGGK